MTDQHIQRQRPPKDVLDLAHARREARADRDWSRADELRDEIESAGWRVVDRGVDFELTPAHAPDVAVGDPGPYRATPTLPPRLPRPPTAARSPVHGACDQAIYGTSRRPPPETSTPSKATSRGSGAPITSTAGRSTSISGSIAIWISGGASSCATKGWQWIPDAPCNWPA